MFSTCFTASCHYSLNQKQNLDADILKNYRPVSNLPALGKIIEYPAVSRLKQHLVDHDLSDPFQSAYKACHSTETALLKVKNDILQDLDKGRAVLMVLLDLSAAFDTIDHDILINRMKNDLGITGPAINWFKSYLADRKTKVCVLGELDHLFLLCMHNPSQRSLSGII